MKINFSTLNVAEIKTFVPGTLKTTNLEASISSFLSSALVLASVACVGYIFWSGFEYLQSNGDSGRQEKAKKALTYAITGLIVIIMALAIINTISFVLKDAKTV